MRGLCKLLVAALLLFPVTSAEAQSDLPEDDRHGKEGTWNLGPKELPPTERPPTQKRKKSEIEKNVRLRRSIVVQRY